MRLDGPQTMDSFQYDGLVHSGSEEFRDLKEHSNSEDFSGSEGCSDSEKHRNSERPSASSLSFEPKPKIVSHLELSIHKICHYRLGPALWTYHRNSDNLKDLLMPLRSPTDILGNTFDKNCLGQMKLFAMIHEAGLLHFHFREDTGLS